MIILEIPRHCLKIEICPTARDFFARRSQFDAGILGAFQGKLVKHGGKRAAIWVC
jgi:hypothetical protein